MVIVRGTGLEVVDHYVYLGQIAELGSAELGRSNFKKEVNRRIQLGWAAFGKLLLLTRYYRIGQLKRYELDHNTSMVKIRTIYFALCAWR